MTTLVERLPLEVLRLILAQPTLTVSDLLSLSLTCRALNELVSYHVDSVWRGHCIARFAVDENNPDGDTDAETWEERIQAADTATAAGASERPYTSDVSTESMGVGATAAATAAASSMVTLAPVQSARTTAPAAVAAAAATGTASPSTADTESMSSGTDDATPATATAASPWKLRYARHNQAFGHLLPVYTRMRRAWRTFTSWLEAHAPRGFASLQPGTTGAQFGRCVVVVVELACLV